MTALDWTIVVAYLAGCTLAGLWMRRYVRNVDDFAIAAREMEVNLGVASLAATEVGIVTVMYTAEMGFKHGLAGATTGVLTALAMLLVGLTGFVIVPLRNARVMTIPELFEKRFGKRVRWLAGLVVILGGVLNMGVFLRAGGDFLMYATGMDSTVKFTFPGTGWHIGYLELIMTALLGIVLVYTVLGGMLSVLITDYLQFLVMGAGIVVTSVLVLRSVGWTELPARLWDRYQRAVRYEPPEPAKLQEVGRQYEAMRMAKDPQRARQQWAALVQPLAEQGTLVGTSPPAPGRPAEPPKVFRLSHPFDPTRNAGMGWGYVIWQAITALAVVTTWQTTIARVLAARDAQTAKRVYRGTWFYFVGRWCLPGLWGVGALLYFASQGGLEPGVTSNTAMPRFLHTVLSGTYGFMGLVIAAMLAAEMSTDSGYLLTWATVIYNDLICPCLRKPLSERARLVIIRLVVLAIGMFLVFWGLWYEPPGSIWDYLAITGNIYLASLFAMLVGALYWRRANSWGAVAAIVLGAVGPITFLIVNFFHPEGTPGHIPAEVSGLTAFALAFFGMFAGSVLGNALGTGRGAQTAQDST